MRLIQIPSEAQGLFALVVKILYIFDFFEDSCNGILNHTHLLRILFSLLNFLLVLHLSPLVSDLGHLGILILVFTLLRDIIKTFHG